MAGGGVERGRWRKGGRSEAERMTGRRGVAGTMDRGSGERSGDVGRLRGGRGNDGRWEGWSGDDGRRDELWSEDDGHETALVESDQI
jgi:hypothetical protein